MRFSFASMALTIDSREAVASFVQVPGLDRQGATHEGKEGSEGKEKGGGRKREEGLKKGKQNREGR
jgi:hypothetical protein